MNPCCVCCVAADERGELDHPVGSACPHPACDYCTGRADTPRIVAEHIYQRELASA